MPIFLSFLWHFFHDKGIEVTDIGAYVDTPTNLTCKISGLSTKATVTWRNNLNEELDFEEGELGADGIQISTLTVPRPRKGADTFSCVVTSGKYPTSPSFEAVAKINTFCKFFFLLRIWVDAQTETQTQKRNRHIHRNRHRHRHRHKHTHTQTF